MKLYVGFLVFITVFSFTNAVDSVNKCKGSSFTPNAEDIDISNCTEPPCQLKKKTTINVKFKIVPDEDVPKVTNSVSAIMGQIPLPFVGVNGKDACPDITDENRKPGCPLKAGQTYYLKDQFDILPMYPTASFDVHWSLKNNKTDKDFFCFEIPAKIIK